MTHELISADSPWMADFPEEDRSRILYQNAEQLYNL
jgi:predicted TIM-barrel fold metal-dependent hydrolase